MTALIVAVTELRPVDLVPGPIRSEITHFCESGHTGQIVLHIKDGEIRSASVSRSIDARARTDEIPPPVLRSER